MMKRLEVLVIRKAQLCLGCSMRQFDPARPGNFRLRLASIQVVLDMRQACRPARSEFRGSWILDNCSRKFQDDG